MSDLAQLTPAAIRQARSDNENMRDRDLADKLNIREGQLVAAFVGQDVTCIAASPDDIMPRLKDLGEVMALTRNRSCVIEKVGVYDNFHSGPHASMILNEEIDLRIFGRHFVSAFAVERETKNGVKRSIQIFDAAGDAVHKIHLRPASDLNAWTKLVADLQLEEQSQTLDASPRKPIEGAKTNPDKADQLRAEWAKMTDTHQFLRLVPKLKMNRLGAYRIVGEPMARQLAAGEVNTMLNAALGQNVEVMIFVGNMGCIEIHAGPILNLREMGPWQNILDPGFDLHLRMDHVAEVWAVKKPTKRGPAISVEAFDAEGGIIFQVFGRRSDAKDHRPAWDTIVEGLASVAVTEQV